MNLSIYIEGVAERGDGACAPYMDAPPLDGVESMGPLNSLDTMPRLVRQVCEANSSELNKGSLTHGPVSTRSVPDQLH